MLRVLVRALEWRAQRFSDPADRLQFLRRNVSLRPASKGWVRIAKHASVIVITLAVVLLPAAWFWMSSRHVTVADANTTTASVPRRAPVEPEPAERVNFGPAPGGPVWLVQSTPQFDLYSNGLRIEEQYATSTAPRRYLAFANDRSGPIASGAEWRTEPAGIVYHTTESHLAPFQEDQNQLLRRAGEGMLEWVSRQHAYHFVIDRFGRVFRVVRESDYANHAGNSVWADRRWIYINLNQSFFGVAFEASSTSTGMEAAANSAQIYAGRILTQMLRARYGIPASNCVAHAQVSINPANREVGYHMDWAANLPFAQLGLTDNYKLALPSVELFGFETNVTRVERSASSKIEAKIEGKTPEMTQGMAQGLKAADAQVRRDAVAQNLPVERYRAKLQKRYRDAIRALRGKDAYQEYN
jgi:N-acetylmuramoyl-L-alanine amidase